MGSRDAHKATVRTDVRLHVSTYQGHGHSDISIFVDGAPLKHARALRFSSAEPVANHQSQAIKMAVSPPFRA
jgi:hypothetical protein